MGLFHRDKAEKKQKAHGEEASQEGALAAADQTAETAEKEKN